MTDHIPIDDLSAHIDGALPQARRDLIDAHLAVCADCRAERASLAWAAGFALALPPAELPAGVSFGVPIEVARPAKRRFARPRSRPGWWALAGLGVALLVVALGLARSWSTRSPPTPERAADAGGEVAGDLADAGAADGSASDGGAGPGAAGVPYPGGQAGPLGGEVAAIASRQPVDIDTAARVAGGLVKQGDGAQVQTRPLATALTADRSQRVLGGARPGAGAVPTPVANPSGATANALATATEPPLDRGGYAPPDAPIPGWSSARTSPRITAGATATGRATRSATATLVVVAGRAATVPAGGMAPPAPGTLTAWAATNTIDRAHSAATGTALATASSESTRSPVSTVAPTGSAAPAPFGSLTPVSSGALPDARTMPSRSLLVPLSALSVGLLAIGILFWRQARARSRRRSWRQG